MRQGGQRVTLWTPSRKNNDCSEVQRYLQPAPLHTSLRPDKSIYFGSWCGICFFPFNSSYFLTVPDEYDVIAGGSNQKHWNVKLWINITYELLLHQGRVMCYGEPCGSQPGMVGRTAVQLTRLFVWTTMFARTCDQLVMVYIIQDDIICCITYNRNGHASQISMSLLWKKANFHP